MFEVWLDPAVSWGGAFFDEPLSVEGMMADDPVPDSTIRCLCTALESNNWPAVEAAIEKVEAAGIWRSSIMAIVKIGKPHPKISTGFHTLWTVKGHLIREQVLDDDLLRDALHILLPVYVGPDLTLYRGENVDRWKTQAYGFTWTKEINVARMFARGLNAAHGQGGVLLSTDAPIEAIIAGPSQHSIYLGEHEYVVDWCKLREITPLECFPRIN